MTPHEGQEALPPRGKIDRAKISKELWKFFEEHFPEVEGEKLVEMMKVSLGVLERHGHLDPIDQTKQEKT